MTNLPQRKRNRLEAYDYSAPGAYFVTICTHEKRCILSRIVVGALHEAPAVRLTEAGVIVQRVIEALPARFPELRLDNFIIMPNHIHLLLQITGERALREAPLQKDGGRSLLAQAVGYLKMNSSKAIHMRYPELTVWQRSFHEHVIRGDDDYREIYEYITDNPARWAEDRYHMEER